MPDALYEPLFARLCATANVVPVVEAAGVIGRQVDRGLLCAVCALSEDEVDDVIDELEDALVLEPWGTDGWRFRHELLREVAAELAPPSVRRGLHAKVADALVHGVGAGDPDWRLVAAHYEQAERFDEAAWAYQQASAAAARRRGALAEARTYLTLALAGLDRTAPGPDRDRREIAVRLERGFLAAALEGNQTRAAVGDFERCLQLGGTDLGDETGRDDGCPDGLLLHTRRSASGGRGARDVARGPQAGAAVVASGDRGFVRCGGMASR